MTIYVDDLMRYFGEGERSCHMFTDGDEAELIAFARRIGLKPQRIQRTSLTHFDLTPPKRAAAVLAGAREIERTEILNLPLLRSARAPEQPR